MTKPNEHGHGEKVADATRVVTSVRDDLRDFGAIIPPVVHASLYGHQSYDDFDAAASTPYDSPFYSRFFNPTVRAFERKIAKLEMADSAIAFSSGMAAISAVLLSFLNNGDHALIQDGVFGPTREFCCSMLHNKGIDVEFFSGDDLHDLDGAVREQTRIVFVESPASLTFETCDLRQIGKIGSSRGLVTIADNSWATPVFQRPREQGIDVVVHSGTKYLSGHSDLSLGVIACSQSSYDIIKPNAVLLGACLSPDDAFLALRGLRTLPIRMKQHESSAIEIAQWLAKQQQVEHVYHPLLENAGDSLEMDGTSGVFSFRLKSDDRASVRDFVDAFKTIIIGTSWGGFETTILPVNVGFRSELQRRTNTGLLRLSVGLEEPREVIADLERGFAALCGD